MLSSPNDPYDIHIVQAYTQTVTDIAMQCAASYAEYIFLIFSSLLFCLALAFHSIFVSLHATAEHATTAALPALRLALHLLADLDVGLEELGYAAVETDGLALV